MQRIHGKTSKIRQTPKFARKDPARWAREKLGKIRQADSVSKFLSGFRNIVSTIRDLTDAEKFDWFFDIL